MEETITVLALLEFALGYVAPIAMQLYLVIIQLNFALPYHKLVGIRVLPPAAAHIAQLLMIGAVLNLNKFFDAPDAKIFTELKMTLFEYFLEIKLTLLKCFKKEIIVVVALKEVANRAVEYFLDLLKLVNGFRLKEGVINAPIF